MGRLTRLALLPGPGSYGDSTSLWPSSLSRTVKLQVQHLGVLLEVTVRRVDG